MKIASIMQSSGIYVSVTLSEPVIGAVWPAPLHQRPVIGPAGLSKSLSELVLPGGHHPPQLGGMRGTLPDRCRRSRWPARASQAGGGALHVGQAPQRPGHSTLETSV